MDQIFDISSRETARGVNLTFSTASARFESVRKGWLAIAPWIMERVRRGREWRSRATAPSIRCVSSSVSLP